MIYRALVELAFWAPYQLGRTIGWVTDRVLGPEDVYEYQYSTTPHAPPDA